MTFGDVWEFLSEHKEHKVLRSSITLGDILNDMLKCHQEVIDAKLTIAALTARAEQAEAREKAAVADIESLLSQDDCAGAVCWACARDCGNDGECKPKWRGLPQEGDGK